MTFGLVYWILMLLWAVFGVWGYYTNPPWRWWAHGVFFFVLFLLLGWKVFGPPIHP